MRLGCVKMIAKKNDLKWPVNEDLAESILVCLAVLQEYGLGDVKNVKNLSGTMFDLVAFSYAPQIEDYRERAHQVIDERCVNQEVRIRLHDWVYGYWRFTKDIGGASRTGDPSTP